jgi:hypothetical protein
MSIISAGCDFTTKSGGIWKKPEEMDISLRQNWAFKLDTPCPDTA